MKEEIKDQIREELRKEFQKDWEKAKKKNPHTDENSWWEERKMGMKVFLGFLMGIGFICLLFLFGWVVMLLWNRLMPEIFGLKTISYWQGWGLLVLSQILFKNFHSGGKESSKRKNRRRRKELKSLMDEKVFCPENPRASEEPAQEGGFDNRQSPGTDGEEGNSQGHS